MERVFRLRYKGKVLSKKNRHVVARIGRRLAVLPDHEATQNEQAIASQFTAQMKQDEWLKNRTFKDKTRLVLDAERSGAEYEIAITITQSDGIRRDLDNQTSTIMDALVKAGAIPDDCRKFVKVIIIRDGGVSKDEAGAIVTIKETTKA